MSSVMKVRGGADDDVVLTGLSGRLPESDCIEEFAQHLFDGVDMVTEDDRRWTPGLYGLPKRNGKLKDLAHFDANFFGVHGKQVDVMDPAQRLLLELTHEVIVDAGWNPMELRGSRTGVYVGLTTSESGNILATDVDQITGYVLLGCSHSLFPNRVSYTFDFKGPSLAIDTACSGAMVALTHAVNAIRAGHCDAAIVAGCNLCLRPATSLNFNRLNLLSPEGRSAAYDASANGYVRSEAVVAVMLQRRRDARRLYCTVRGARINTDGYKEQGVTYPGGSMQSRLVEETFEEAHLRPQDVDYVEGHGTGTKVGDVEEVNAIAEVFCKSRQTPLLLGSVKTNMGHSEAASGLASIAKIVLAMERLIIPKNLHFTKPNPNMPSLSDGRIKVVDKNTPWQGGLVAVSSFGFGGANAHVILESHRGERAPLAKYEAPRLVLASGRTDEAVEKLLALAVEHQRDAELHALLDAVHAHAIPGHPRRGYAVLDPVRGVAPITEVLECEGEPRPVWFVFSGMGSQWAGMARTLLRLPTFAASIARSAAVLEPYGVDLQHVIAEASDAAFDNLINCFVSIAAVQVALVDVLRELGMRPDGIIGHSVGEIGCAYADETLTAEQTVLCAYWRGRCTLDAAPVPGAMAAVGLPWEEAARRLPEDVELACHNSANSVTISGPLASVEKFVKKLSEDGVFVRHVSTGGVAFHSKYIAAVAPLLLTKLQQIIPEPKPRSARWLSSSVPQGQWNSELAKLSDARYHVNNLLSPVRFASVLSLVPENALLVEVAPHALLQAVLKRALPQAAHVPLVRRDAPDALKHLLSAIGKAYAAGAQPKVSLLYPPVAWPVSRGTPALASHVVWDHSIEWQVADYKAMCHTGENVIEYDLGKPEDAFIAGHNIDGRVIFPGTGYLTMVWRTLAKLKNEEMENVAVVLEDVQFRRPTIVSRDTPLRFLVTLLGGTGEFEVCEGGAVVVTGRARFTDDPAADRLSDTLLREAEVEEDMPPLSSEDIYKDLRLRGYYYEGAFRGIKSCDARGSRGLLNWDGNWISFMDTAIQLGLVDMDTQALYLPTRIQRVVIDPKRQREAVAMATGGAIPGACNHKINVIVSGGVELQGISKSMAPRRGEMQVPKLEKYVFLPFENTCFEKEDIERCKGHVLTAAVQLVLENTAALQIKLAEFALQRPVDELLLPLTLQVLEAEPGVRASASLVAGADASQYAAAMKAFQIKVSDKKCMEPGYNMVLGADVLARPGADVLSALADASGEGFVLLREPVRAFHDPAVQALLNSVGLMLVSRARLLNYEYLLLRHAISLPATREVIEVRDDDFAWVEKLKEAMKRAETEDMRVYVWSRELGSGVQGLATCARREPGGDKLRLYYLPGAKKEFDPEARDYKEQVKRDLAFNVLRSGVWGTFRHLPLNDTSDTELEVEHAYVNTLTRGDLSSLRWIENDLAHATAAPQLCCVYYASLNFRDVMLATGKLPPDALADARRDCLIGLEFSGHSSSGKRVMGLGPRGLATSVLADSDFLWEVPSHWSLEEAATVPMAYGTAYYALVVRGRMRRGETVLIHAGSGGVGQAAITIALHMGCTVFTTVGTPEKRAFLRDRFPELPEANIGNSRDCSFEQLVLLSTEGHGVDLVLNSLAGEQLQASLRCIATCGRFLEIGKFDLNANKALGMAILLKNVTVHGIMLDTLMFIKNDHPDKKDIVQCVAEGIAAGIVRPLPVSVYAHNQLEQAFRYMATGKHIGKVLIRLREEEAGNAPAPTRLLPAMPRTYMHPSKSYVLIGGLGGFGLELGTWLVDRGARTLVLHSRNGVRTGYQALCIRRWRDKGVHVLVSVKDATTMTGAQELLQEATAAAPVGGIFNLAAVLRDAFLENQTPDDFRAVTKPKIEATRALDAASRKLALQLDYFVVFSSVSCGRGNPGQTNYGLANSAMERLCEHRRADGLPALAVQWGAIGEVGLVAAMQGDEITEVGGTVPQRVASCLATLSSLLALPHAVVSSIVLANKHRAQDKPTQDLVTTVANILGIKDPSKVSEKAQLGELGMDSLMGAEIRQTLERSYDILLGVHEIRALTFGKLRGIGSGSLATVTADETSSPASNGDKLTFNELMPKQVLVKLPSQPPENSHYKPIFMVHPIEGVVDMLRGIAASVRGTVYGLQCTSSAPLDDMVALAHFYVKYVRTTQPQPPYTLLGYSFGASVAFEMALQLEKEGCDTRLVLVDGSPAFYSSHSKRIKDIRTTRTPQSNEADVLAYFGKVFYDLDLPTVADELKLLDSWEKRVARLMEMLDATGVHVTKDDVGSAAHSLYRRLLVGDSYKPSARVTAPVTLFKARDSYVALDEDYGLRAMCAGELRMRQLAGTHRTILASDSARAIADHVSELIAQQCL